MESDCENWARRVHPSATIQLESRPFCVYITPCTCTLISAANQISAGPRCAMAGSLSHLALSHDCSFCHSSSLLGPCESCHPAPSSIVVEWAGSARTHINKNKSQCRIQTSSSLIQLLAMREGIQLTATRGGSRAFSGLARTCSSRSSRRPEASVAS